MSWLHRIIGKDGSSQLGVESTHFAARMAARPMHLGANGASFGLSVASSVMAAGITPNSEIFQMRWTHATFKMLLRSIQLNVYRASATAFTAGTFNFQANHARSWSADGTGAIAVTMSTANTNKKRTDFNLSKFSDSGIRRADVGAVGAGTKTVDTNPFAQIGGFTGAVAPAATVEVAPHIITPGTYLYKRDASDEYPVLYEQNEGVIVRCTIPATGTWGFTVTVEWTELDPTEVEGWT